MTNNTGNNNIEDRVNNTQVVNRKEKYIRIGISLYKIVDKPQADGSTVVRRMPWSFRTLQQDYGKGNIPEIKKYEGFCSVPSHLDYKREINGFYNLYEPVTHIPKQGVFPCIMKLVRHIFGEQYELGMDYMQLLYTQPLQKLPILLLVSKERNTGKTTFLKFLKAVFQNNVTFNNNEAFRSQFNSDWTGKLIIEVDEAFLTKLQEAERLKNLSTADDYKVEAKGKDKEEINFFGKFVLCSNNELSAIIIDEEETRYWVRKITPLENDDTHFLEKLKKEIPAFLYYLLHRPLTTQQVSRMWFDPSLIRTEALKRIMRYNRDSKIIDIAEVLRDVMDSQGVDSVSFVPRDLMGLLASNGVKAQLSEVRRVLKNKWNLKPSANSYIYTSYEYDYNSPTTYVGIKRTGRFYTVTKEFIDKLDI